MAQGIFETLLRSRGLEDRFEVDSAGTMDWNSGKRPEKRAQAEALRHGIDISGQRSRPVAAADFHHFDYIVAMAEDNFADLRAECPPTLLRKLHRFVEFAQHPNVPEIPDPYPGTATFSEVFDLLDACAHGLLEHLLQNEPGARGPAA